MGFGGVRGLGGKRMLRGFRLSVSREAGKLWPCVKGYDLPSRAAQLHVSANP